MDDWQFIPFINDENKKNETVYRRYGLRSLSPGFEAILVQGFRLIRDSSRIAVEKKGSVDWLNHRMQFTRLREHAAKPDAIPKLRRFVIRLKAELDANSASGGIWRRQGLIKKLSQESQWSHWLEHMSHGRSSRLEQLQRRFFTHENCWHLSPAAIIYLYEQICPELLSLFDLALSELKNKKRSLPKEFVETYENYLRGQQRRILHLQQNLQRYALMMLQVMDWHQHADPLKQLCSDLEEIGIEQSNHERVDYEWEWRNDETLRLLKIAAQQSSGAQRKEFAQLSWWFNGQHVGQIFLEKRQSEHEMWLVPKEFTNMIPLNEEWPAWLFFGSRFRRNFFKPYLKDFMSLNKWFEELSELSFHKEDSAATTWQKLCDQTIRLRALEDVLQRLLRDAEKTALPWYHRWFSSQSMQMLQNWRSQIKRCQQVIDQYQQEWLRQLLQLSQSHNSEICREAELCLHHQKIWPYVQECVLKLEIGKQPAHENLVIETYQKYTSTIHPVGRCLWRVFYWLQKQASRERSEFLSQFIQRQEQCLAMYSQDQDIIRLQPLLDLLKGRYPSDQSPQHFADYLLGLCAAFSPTLSSSDLLRLLLQEIILPRIKHPEQPEYRFVAELSPREAELWLQGEKKTIANFITLMAQLLEKLRTCPQLDLTQPVFLICGEQTLQLTPLQLTLRLQHFKRLATIFPDAKQELHRVMSEYLTNYSGEDVRLLPLLDEVNDEEMLRIYYNHRIQFLLSQKNWQCLEQAKECHSQAVPKNLHSAIHLTLCEWIRTQNDFIPDAHHALMQWGYFPAVDNYLLKGIRIICTENESEHCATIQKYLSQIKLVASFVESHREELEEMMAKLFESPVLNTAQVFWLEQFLVEPWLSTFSWQKWLEPLRVQKLRLHLATSIQTALDRAQNALKKQNIEVVQEILLQYSVELATAGSEQKPMIQAFLSGLGRNLRKVVVENIQQMNFYQNNHWEQRCIFSHLQENEPVLDWYFLLQLCRYPEQAYLAWFDMQDRGKYHQAMWLQWQQWNAQGWLSIQELGTFARYMRLWEFESREYPDGCGQSYKAMHQRIVSQCYKQANCIWEMPPQITLSGSELYYLDCYTPIDAKIRRSVKRMAATLLIYDFLHASQKDSKNKTDQSHIYYHAIGAFSGQTQPGDQKLLRKTMIWLWQDWLQEQIAQMLPDKSERLEYLREYKTRLQWLDKEDESRLPYGKETALNHLKEIKAPALLQQAWNWLHGKENITEPALAPPLSPRTPKE